MNLLSLKGKLRFLPLREQEYCYVGSETDPATGEIVDLYVLCGDDEVTDSLTPS
jgi:carbonic anhydrase